MDISFRPMQQRDLRTCLSWAADEGWNPGIDDADAFFQTDPDGFFVAESAGEPVASISVINHSASFSFLGLYICKPAFRGRGIGFRLWEHALRHAESRTVGLDGVIEQQENYRKSGFVAAGSTHRFEGFLQPALDPEIRAIEPADISQLVTLDGKAAGFLKKQFLQGWLTNTENRSSIVYAPGGKLAGFATIRRCIQGAKIGPVIAPDIDVTLKLIRACAGLFETRHIVVDVPESNQPLVSTLTENDFSATFSTARMYRGTPPNGNAMLQGVATLELG